MLSALHNILSIAVTDKYTAEDMKFIWQNDPPLSFPSDFGDGYRLPKYVVSFVTENKTHNVYYGEGIRSIGIQIVHSFQTFTYTKYKDLHGLQALLVTSPNFNQLYWMPTMHLCSLNIQVEMLLLDFCWFMNLSGDYNSY